MRAASCKHKADGTDGANTASDERKAKKTKKDELSSKAVVGRTDKEMREERLMRRRQKKAEAESAVSPLPAEAFCCGEVDTTETPHCEAGPAPWNGKAYAGAGAIGRKVRVYWKDDDDWFPGIVAAYDATRPERRYLVFYDDCEFEWVALAGPGPDERVQFHRSRPEFQMITELNLRVRFMKVATERPEHVAACVACGKEAVRECSNAVRWEVHPWSIKVLCKSGEHICTKCCKEDSWECSACRALAAAPLPPRPDFPWHIWSVPNEQAPPLPRETHVPGRTEVIFHRPSFHKAMKEWTEQANLAGSPLPYFHPEWFAQNYGPRAATPSGSA